MKEILGWDFLPGGLSFFLVSDIQAGGSFAILIL